MMRKRVVVTGGSGFVGTNLVSYFAKQGWEVLNLDIAEPRNQRHRSHWRKVDLLHRSQLISEIQSFEPSVLLHFGGRTDLAEQRNLAGYAANIEGTCNVIEAARSTPAITKAVFASSQLVCRLGYLPQGDYDYQPSTLYGLSKAISERIIRAADDFCATWVIIRPTSLWGPWFDVPYRDFFDAIRSNLYVHPGRVVTLKQWGYIGNTAYQVWRLIHAPVELIHRKTLYVADYEPIDLRVFASKVQAALGARPIKTVPTAIIEAVAKIGDILALFGLKMPMTSFRYRNIVTPEIHNLEPLKRIVGPLPYSLDQGVEDTVRWLGAVQT
jgi:nucleoside-diphosphate-sugar epimerase